MHKIVTNKYRFQYNGKGRDAAKPQTDTGLLGREYVPRNAKLLAWAIFLYLFIENGTIGLLPRQFYMIYRNVRVSDLILYVLVVYSFYCSREFKELLKSKALIITNILLIYLLLRFLASVITYQVNLVEFFFRLKYLWSSLLVFPFLLLIKRNGLNYLVKIILPFAILSNILYIISSVTGIALLPNMTILKQELPGGLEVYRVYGGTFYGETYFLALMFFMITQRFRISYLVLAILFVLPHILAFGRGTWAAFLFSIMIYLIYNTLKKRGFKVLLRQIILLFIVAGALIYSFTIVIPESGYFSEALQSRITQGQEDIKYSEGTYGSRIANVTPLLELWQNTDILFGIGMHPFWVIKPETTEEEIYQWGFFDLTWAPVLTAYGLIGFILFIIFEIYYFYITFKIIKKLPEANLFIFFCISVISSFLFSAISYSYQLLAIGIYGPGYSFALAIAIIVYVYEKRLPKKASVS